MFGGCPVGRGLIRFRIFMTFNFFSFVCMTKAPATEKIQNHDGEPFHCNKVSVRVNL